MLSNHISEHEINKVHPTTCIFKSIRRLEHNRGKKISECVLVVSKAKGNITMVFECIHLYICICICVCINRHFSLPAFRVNVFLKMDNHHQHLRNTSQTKPGY